MNRDSDHLGKFVGMIGSDHRFDLGIASFRGFDLQGDFGGVFGFPAPVVK